MLILKKSHNLLRKIDINGHKIFSATTDSFILSGINLEKIFCTINIPKKKKNYIDSINLCLKKY